jgi:PhzF family phenazine biosynthesis protein
MRKRPFKQVDVFTSTPYRGNPLAVVLDGDGLSGEQMQRFTSWTNLSEATFVLPPTPEGAAAGADYRVRIFCPGRELPFAGHPTLGTCHGWLEAGGRPRAEHILQECGAGLIRIRRAPDLLAFAAPPLKRSGPLAEDEVARVASALHIPRGDIIAHAWCNNGPNWRAVMLKSAAQVLALKPDAAAFTSLEVGVVGPHLASDPSSPRPDDAPAFEVRAFFPGNGAMAEDPVTGSLNAALAQWLIGAGLAPPTYIASQGAALDRAGRVHVERQGADIWIGGGAVTCIHGEVTL